MLAGIARLAIAAPRRIIAVALLVMVGSGGVRHPGHQEPVGGRLPGPDLGVGRRPRRCSPTRSARATWSSSSASRRTRARESPQATRGGHRHRASAAGLPGRGAGELGVDVATVGGAGAGQQGRQDRADRRRHLRHGKPGAAAREGPDRAGGARPRRGHRQGRRRGDDLRADQRPERKRPAAHGVDRDSAELSSCWSGCSAACSQPRCRWRSAASRSSGRWPCCTRSRSRPTCRSSR